MPSPEWARRQQQMTDLVSDHVAQERAQILRPLQGHTFDAPVHDVGHPSARLDKSHRHARVPDGRFHRRRHQRDEEDGRQILGGCRFDGLSDS